MKKPSLPILATLAVSTILRLFNLGSVPAGLSLTEVQFGLWISRFGTWVLNPIVVILPFAILGILSVYLSYILVKKLFESEKLALISSFLLSFIPWHVQESRIFSWGIILFTLFEIVAILIIKYFNKIYLKIPKFNLFLGIVLLITCALSPIKDISTQVNVDRLAVSKTSQNILSKIFINKLTENYRQREDILFTNLDFGNYFFAGHPRERGGVEETQKLLLFILPFIILGLIKIKKEQGNFLLVWTIISLFILTFFNLQESQTLLLILPLIILGSVGIEEALSNKKQVIKTMVYLIFVFGLFESVSFYSLYFSGNSESQFSPRRPVYPAVISEIMKVRRPSEEVLVNDRLEDPEPFFDFYLKKNITSYEFRSFNYHNEKETNKLFVDVLPDDPISNEPLYTKDGSWPCNLNILAVFYDSGKKQKVVIY